MDTSHPLVQAALRDFQDHPQKAESELDYFVEHPTRLTPLAQLIKDGKTTEAEKSFAARGAEGFLHENEQALFRAFILHFAAKKA